MNDLFFSRNAAQRPHTPPYSRITISICFTTINITSPSSVPLCRFPSHHGFTDTLLLCIRRCSFDLIQSSLPLLFTSGIATWARDHQNLLQMVLPGYCLWHIRRSELKHGYDVDELMHHLIGLSIVSVIGSLVEFLPAMILLLRTVTAFPLGRRFDPIPLQFHLLPVLNPMFIFIVHTSQVDWALYPSFKDYHMTGIDTITLLFKDVVVERNCPLNLRKADIKVATGHSRDFPLCRTVKGDYLWGVRAFYNDEMGFSFDLTVYGAYLKFSIPKILYRGNNLLPVDREDTIAVLQNIRDRLERLGIYTPNLTSKAVCISRLDLFRNIEMDHPFTDYWPLFMYLKGKRKQQKEYETTFIWCNKEREISIYDKITEMSNNHFDVSSLERKNLFRCEYRALKKRVVEKVSGFMDVSVLLKRFGEITDIYRTQLIRELFDREIIIHETSTHEIGIDRLQSYIENLGVQSGISEYKNELFYTQLIDVFGGDLVAIEQYLGEIVSRTTAWRYGTSIREYAFSDAGPTAMSKLSVGLLYEEMAEKLLE